MIGFFVGVVLTGIALSIVFGAIILEAEEKAYMRGYHDGERNSRNS